MSRASLLLRGNRAGQEARTPRPAVLGPPRPRLRRRTRASAHRRPGARRARLQSHRPAFYRRRFGPLALSRAAPSRLRRSRRIARARRRARTARRPDYRSVALRAAAQQAYSATIAALRTISRSRAFALAGTASHPRSGSDRDAGRRRGPPPVGLSLRTLV